MFDYFKTHPCVDCGENDYIVLEFDHVRSNKVASISSLIGSGYSVDTVKREIAKCEVRCANCNRRKTAKQFDWYANMGS